MQREKVNWNKECPFCPFCKVSTVITKNGPSMSTLMYFEPRYENGVNVNPDRNSISNNWFCHTCQKGFSTRGNAHDGYFY